MPSGPPSGLDPGSGQGTVRAPRQMSLPIPATGKTGMRRPTQLALPVPVTRVPRPAPSSGGVGAGGRAGVRSRQLMLPGMPRRPVPRRQLTLWTDPPKNRRRR
jgi:hypothetical protein